MPRERSCVMATISPLKAVPHTRIDNSIIDNLSSQIGIYGLGIYVAIKRHLNQKTGECFPSYQTIARKLGIDRSTVIRYVKKLKALNLLSPLLRFKEDGSPTSNQYNFDKGSSSKQPPVVAQDNQPSCTEPPEQSPPNKKQRSITDVDFSTKSPLDAHSTPISTRMSACTEQKEFRPTERQKTCPHPPTEIVILLDNITICHHCYGLLDENLKLREEDREQPELLRHKRGLCRSVTPLRGGTGGKATPGREDESRGCDKISSTCCGRHDAATPRTAKTRALALPIMPLQTRSRCHLTIHQTLGTTTVAGRIIHAAAPRN
jgi:hypothetical protein